MNNLHTAENINTTIANTQEVISPSSLTTRTIEDNSQTPSGSVTNPSGNKYFSLF